MKNCSILFISSALLVLGSCSKNSSPQYEVYNPDIERQQISFPVPGRQHHDAAIAWYKDRWIVQYDDHVVPKGVPQYINQRTSFDFKNWTPEIRVFSDSAGTSDPVKWHGDQWQPGFVNVNNELWSLWTVSKLKEIYFSRLGDPTGKWQNQTIPLTNLFITCNGIVLSNGWVAIPVTKVLSVGGSGILPKDSAYNSDHFIYTADNGKNWQISAGTFAHKGPTWEATIWEPKQGEIWMIARNIGTTRIVQKTPMTEAAGYNYSLDFGKTWVSEKRQLLPMELSNSRPYVLNYKKRNIMLHNDYYTPSLFHAEHRYNVTLFFNRGRGVNFVAGPVIDTRISEYPQIFIHNNQAIVIYSAREQFPGDRFIMVARLKLPEPDKYYIFARTSRGKIDQVDVDGRKAIRFHDNYSSAGIDVDENDSRKDEVHISFDFKIESPGEQSLFTIGFPPVQLVSRENQVILKSETDSVIVGSVQDWTRVELISKPGEISACVGNGKWISMTHKLDQAGRWLYFGQGYYKTNDSTGVRHPQNGKQFLIDISSLKTNVKSFTANK